MRETIRRPKVSEILVQKIRDAITAGRFRPGDQLPSERELMAQYGIGRSAVREALFALQKSGQIQIRNGERALVVEPTPQFILDELTAAVRHMVATDHGMRQFQEVRILIEGALARRAALVATDQEIRAIHGALNDNIAADGDPDALHRTDVGFHFALAQVALNPFITAMHDAVTVWLLDQRKTSIAAPEAARLATRWHQRIFERIAARDGEGAMVAMEGHLRMVSDFYWRVRELERGLRDQQERELGPMPASPIAEGD